jgi:hypothetical protein
MTTAAELDQVADSAPRRRPQPRPGHPTRLRSWWALALVVALAGPAAGADAAPVIERTRAWPVELTGEWRSEDGRRPWLVTATTAQDFDRRAARWADPLAHGELVVVRQGGAVVRIMANPRATDWWSRYTVDAAGHLVEDIGRPTAAGDDLVADADLVRGEVRVRPER